jgi:hypothetical protein
MENTNTPQKNSTNRLLLILLLISVALNAYLFSSKTNLQETYKQEKDSLITARVDVEKELSDTYTELNQYKGINARLDSLLSEANGKVDEQKSKIEKLIRQEGNTKSLNTKLKAELEELKKLRDQYLEKIDALLVENEQLKKDKSDLTSTVESLSKNLESTLTTASVLKAEYIKAGAYKKRSNDKYASTAMAKRTNKIEACFTILENKLAKAGSKNVYLRIIEPGGKVLGNRAEGSSTFRQAGSNEELLFTVSKSIEYANDKQDLCLNWEEKDRIFSSGNYMIEIYVDGNLSGVSSITLR